MLLYLVAVIQLKSLFKDRFSRAQYFKLEKDRSKKLGVSE